MEKKERKNYNTKLDVNLIKKLKFLSVENDTRQNDLLEEAIQDILKKYDNAKKQKNKPKIRTTGKLTKEDNDRINREVTLRTLRQLKSATSQNYFERVNFVVSVSTDVSEGCKHCDVPIGYEHFAESINHYIQVHDYKLLHVGTVTSLDRDDELIYSSVALLGHE